MQIPKFKEFFVEQDLERKEKPITVAIITIADSKDPKENTTADLISKACKKKGIECVIVNTKSKIITQAFMVNTRSAMLTCDNKLTSALLFEKFGIPTPKTAFISNENNIKAGLDMIGSKFPIIMKTLTGTQGVGVIKYLLVQKELTVVMILDQILIEVLRQRLID